MAGRALPKDAALALLRETPARLSAVTTGLTPAQLTTAPAPGEWSANDVLAHLRSCADVWGDSIETILRQEVQTIRAMNPRRWIKSTDYPGLPFDPSLATFTAQRRRLMEILEAVDDADWDLSVRVTGAGKPLQLSVHSYVERLALHERPHVKQVERIAASLRG